MTDQKPSDFVDEHAVLIGRVAMSWNDLSDAFGLIFIELTGMEDEMARAVLFSPPSDRAQREMVMRASKLALGEDSVLHQKLAKCVKEIDATGRGEKRLPFIQVGS